MADAKTSLTTVLKRIKPSGLLPSAAVQLAEELAHPQRCFHRQGRSRWHRVVGHVARTRDQLLVVARRVEEGPGALVPEPPDHRIRPLPGAIEPEAIERQLKK